MNSPTMIEIDKNLINDLCAEAKESVRLRMNFDLRTSTSDNSQRMLNALMPGTVVPIHRHPNSTENIILLCGKITVVFYDEDGNETERYELDPTIGTFGCVIPTGAWHTVEVYEPSVIFEAKDGRFNEDGSETLEEYAKTRKMHPLQCSFTNSLGDLKKNIEYLIGMERHSGSMEVITPLYVSRMLNVPLDFVEKCMKEMGL